MFNKEKLCSLALNTAAVFNPKRTLLRAGSTGWNLACMYAAYETLLWFEWESKVAIVTVVVWQMLWSATLIEETANRDTLARDAEYWQERAQRAERILNVVLPEISDLRRSVGDMKNQSKGGRI